MSSRLSNHPCVGPGIPGQSGSHRPWIATYRYHRVILLKLLEFRLFLFFNLQIVRWRIAPAVNAKEPNLAIVAVHQTFLLTARLQFNQFFRDSDILFGLSRV